MSALLGPADIRQLAAQLGIRPTKTLGQNFLHDANTIRRIVRTAELAPGEPVLEIGPGLGSLTLGLLAAGHPVVAVEIDPVLAQALPATVAARLPAVPGGLSAGLSGSAPSLTVVTADALALRELPVVAAPASTAPASTAAVPTALVANLPYNVAVPVLLHLLARFESLRTALVLVQAEVAERLAAAPGSKAYGVPSVKAAWFGRATRAGTVSPAVFWPVPNVDSGLVRLVRGAPPATTATREQVFAVIDAAFAQRRKMLRSALAGWAGSPAAATAALAGAGIEATARGETLDVAAFARIAEQR